MDAKYQQWTNEYEAGCVRETAIFRRDQFTYKQLVSIAVRGTCQHAVDRMVAAFPELRPVRGHYGGREHWWCIAPDGTIVDPTVKQFAAPNWKYVEHTGPEPVGKCMICGEYVWSYEYTSSACSEDCLAELKAEYGDIGGGDVRTGE